MSASVGNVVLGGEHPPIEIDAGTVVLVRDGAKGCECLMLAKTEGQFFGGLWVFPGGRVEPGDGTGIDGARRAAAREAAEETGLSVPAEAMVALSHWSPPLDAAKRFLTWFFIATLPDGAPDVVIDGGEIGDHLWTSPADALAAHGRGEIKLLPPTWVTLYNLCAYDQADQGVAAARVAEPFRFETRIVGDGDAMVALWSPDAAYPDDSGVSGGRASLDVPGPRHRLTMARNDWRYEVTLGGRHPG